MDERSERQESPASALEMIEAFAHESGLRYVHDYDNGYLRKRAGKSFVYFQEKKKVRNASVLKRIKALVIPPAWQNVWICRYDNGHLQATGRDVRGRKQYRYHPKWNEARNETKFSKLLKFGEALPKIRAQVEKDLRKQGLSREKVLAAVVKLMELTRIRVGNDIYAEENESYGLTTILNTHAQVSGRKVKFKFKGKSGVAHDVALTDARLSRIIKQCQELPGEELFAFEDEDGEAHDISSTDVNDYLHAITDERISAKDFRTWGGTVKAVEHLIAIDECAEQTQKARKARQVACIKDVAGHLRNTVAICRKYYVHPSIFAADEDGFLFKAWKKRKRAGGKSSTYSPAERVTLDILERR